MSDQPEVVAEVVPDVNAPLSAPAFVFGYNPGPVHMYPYDTYESRFDKEGRPREAAPLPVAGALALPSSVSTNDTDDTGQTTIAEYDAQGRQVYQYRTCSGHVGIGQGVASVEPLSLDEFLARLVGLSTINVGMVFGAHNEQPPRS